MAGCGGGLRGRLVLGHREAPHSETLGKGGQASEVLLGRAKSFCGLGINDNVASFVPTGY